MKRILRWALSGRPMTYMYYAFTDGVSGLPVNIYRDAKGRHWMARSKWAWFRVPCEYPDAFAPKNVYSPSSGTAPTGEKEGA